MLKTPIKNKKKMYELLKSGALGNTLPLYWDLSFWKSSSDFSSYPLWGVRCNVPGDKRMKLNVPREEVESYVRVNFQDGTTYNISPMIDQWAVFKGEVYELDYPPFGLCLYANFQGNMPWREALRDYGKHYFGLQAKNLLQAYMDPTSYEDVRNLLGQYPHHVLEFSVCSRNVGIIPFRNTLIWEVRLY